MNTLRQLLSARVDALLWDVDGTLAETELEGHLPAFNAAFEACGLPWRWSAPHYRKLLDVTGCYERLLVDLSQRPDAPRDPAERAALARRLQRCKQAILAERSVRHAPPLRDGVLALMRDCDAAGVPMGIATTTARRHVDALLSAHLGAGWSRRFACVLAAEDAARPKPDPQVYRLALARLGVCAERVVAIEDSPDGVLAARGAGIPVVVTRSRCFADVQTPGALACGPSLGSGDGWSPWAGSGRIRLDTIAAWRARSSELDRGAADAVEFDLDALPRRGRQQTAPGSSGDEGAGRYDAPVARRMPEPARHDREWITQRMAAGEANRRAGGIA